VAVTREDVLHVAALARIGVSAERLPSLVSELNEILGHMEVLSRVETGREMGDGRIEKTATAMRSDADGASIPLAVPREDFAPQMRDGFFLVPRLATHEGEGERSP